MAWYSSHVIPCHWSFSDAGWRLWVRGRPDIQGTGTDFATAEEALIDAIMSAAPDIDVVDPVVPEYDPPLPLSGAARQFRQPELYLLWGDAIFETGSRDTDLLYEGGLCPDCHAVRGSRTAVPLCIRYAESADAGFLRSSAWPDPQLFSERFVALLSLAERDAFEWYPVEFPTRRRGRKFLELRAIPIAPFVSVHGFDADGVECPTCGHRSLHVWDPTIASPPNYIADFVCTTDLPNPPPPLFAIGSAHDWHLCATSQRRNELCRNRHAVGLASRPLGIVSEELCERHPRLARRGYQSDCPICSRWPVPMSTAERERRAFKTDEPIWSPANWAWLPAAEKSGLITVIRRTLPPDLLHQLATSQHPPRPPHPLLLTFRCPACWRLGRIEVTKREVSFVW